MKRSSLQIRVIKFTQKKFYEFDRSEFNLQVYY